MNAQPKAFDIACALSVSIPQAVRELKEKSIQVQPVHSNRCHEIGDDCERRLVYRRTNWQDALKPPVELQFIFDEGAIQEREVRRTLEDAGFVLNGDGSSYSWKEYQISGSIDGKIIGDRHGIFPVAIPYDAKSMSPYVYEQINSKEDFKKYPWTRKYTSQLVMYMLLMGAEAGVFVLKNKSSGQLKVIPIELDLELGEELLQRAERINKHVVEGTFPERIEYSDDVCGKCQFVHLCNPDVDYKGVHFENDEEALLKIDRMKELEESAKEYESLKKEIVDGYKTRMTDKNGEKFVVGGKYAITGKWITKEMPPKEASIQEYWMTKIIPVDKLKV